MTLLLLGIAITVCLMVGAALMVGAGLENSVPTLLSGLVLHVLALFMAFYAGGLV